MRDGTLVAESSDPIKDMADLTSMIKSPFAPLALGLWILACASLLAEDDDPNALNQRVSQLIEQGKYQEAIPIAERAVEVAKRARGPEHPETADALNNLGFLYKKTGDYAKAEPLYQEALRIRQKVLGPEHPDTRRASITWPCCTRPWASTPKPNRSFKKRSGSGRRFLGQNIPTPREPQQPGRLYQAMGEYAKAEPLYQEALRIRQKVLGPEHPDTATSLNNLASLYRAMGEYAKAEPLLPGSAPDPAEGSWARTSRHGDQPQ